MPNTRKPLPEAFVCRQLAKPVRVDPYRRPCGLIRHPYVDDANTSSIGKTKLPSRIGRPSIFRGHAHLNERHGPIPDVHDILFSASLRWELLTSMTGEVFGQEDHLPRNLPKN